MTRPVSTARCAQRSEPPSTRGVGATGWSLTAPEPRRAERRRLPTAGVRAYDRLSSVRSPALAYRVDDVLNAFGHRYRDERPDDAEQRREDDHRDNREERVDLDRLLEDLRRDQ